MPILEHEKHAAHYIQVNDFSPGIVQRVNKTGFSAIQGRNGQATVNTYRCLPLPSGGIAPGPQRTNAYTRTAPDTIGQVTGGYFHIVGIHCDGPVIESGVAGSDTCEAFVAYEWINNVAVKRHFLLEPLKLFHSTGNPTVDTVENTTSTQAPPGDTYRQCCFANYRADPAATLPTTPTYNPVVAYAWYSGG